MPALWIRGDIAPQDLRRLAKLVMNRGLRSGSWPSQAHWTG